LLAIVPNLAATTFYTKRCLVSYTPHGKPFIDQIEEGLFVAAGGNGSSAKCSDTIGKMAAGLITQEAWPSIFSRSSFKAEFA
jgi:sarcosine oxidase